jgi:hypothetical protein
MIEDIRMTARAADEPPNLVSLETGEEERPSPTDRGDEKSCFHDNEPMPRLRDSKSTGDLHAKSTAKLGNNSRKKLA